MIDSVEVKVRLDDTQNQKKIILKADHIKKYFPVKSGILSREVKYVKAVDDISLEIFEGETFSLVGESGSGKSTLGRALLRIQEPDEGTISFDGKDITAMNRQQMKDVRKDMQVIYQDPFGSLNPRMKVIDLIAEPLDINNLYRGKERVERVIELMELVGLDPSRRNRYSHEFSGGQRQRIGIARAIALNPKFILADEAVSALDVSVQAQVVNLMKDLQKELGLTYLFIAHGLNIVRYISDRVGVMYLGKLVEVGNVEDIYSRPAHPYTNALIQTNPNPNPRSRREKLILKGEIPSPSNPPSGCRFHTRCPIASDKCKEVSPELREILPGRLVACHYPLI